ncbi:hypothetical protein GOARA_050_00720 [Gordonia araii NBRC 100433]|uniref:Uncharacterized protein n=2 Tax=Gordonia araii TaxID=263909 RepID=G7H2D4_9ACTN|nr:hypothetical protein GOARA_050_00720 [Gordonia araii NBRC 100433]
MLTVADLPSGYAVRPLTIPQLPFEQELKQEKATPSVEDGCHRERVEALEESVDVPMAAISIQPPIGRGLHDYTQVVIHSPDTVDRLLNSNVQCAFTWFFTSAGERFERRINSLPEPPHLPNGVAVTVWSWNTWGVESARTQYRLQGFAVFKGKGMLLETTSPVAIDSKQFQAIFVKAVNKFARTT